VPFAIKSPGHAHSPKPVEPLDPALQELERTLEGTGATALLRSQRNQEVQQEHLERTMYDLNGVTEDLVGKLKREPWRAPDWASGTAHYRSLQVKRPPVDTTGKRFASGGRGGDASGGAAKSAAGGPQGTGALPVGLEEPLSDQLPVCATYTGRMCFVTGCLKGCTACDPFGEGTASQVCGCSGVTVWDNLSVGCGCSHPRESRDPQHQSSCTPPCVS
jgi:hypothetical protein